MKRGWLVVMLLVGLGAPAALRAQVSAYGEFSTSELKGGPQGDYLYGATTGLTVDAFHLGQRVVLSGDLQGRFVGKSGERLNGLTVGPRFTFPMHKWSLAPFAEFMVGFARYNDSHGLSTTDNTFQVNGGVAKQVTPHWDVVVDYSYSQYGVNNGEFNPKTYSAGLMYHLAKR